MTAGASAARMVRRILPHGHNSIRSRRMKKIDAHAHVGYFGSWCDVGLTVRSITKVILSACS
jgi:hypothetical protein